jgi:hypothetical protein
MTDDLDLDLDASYAALDAAYAALDTVYADDEAHEAAATVRIAPTMTPEQGGRADEAACDVERAHRAVADAAGAWVRAGCPPLPPDVVADAGYAWAQRGCPCADDHDGDAASDLHDAVLAWREACERLMRALRGQS